MSDDILGGDVAEMRRVAGLFKTKTAELAAVCTAVESKINGTANWKGKDADAFRTDWKKSFSGRIGNAQKELSTGRTRLLTNADEQDEAQKSL